MPTVNDLLTQVLELPEPERAAMAHELLLSLDSETFDAESNAAWAAEMEARLDRIESGNFVARDWREAIADIRQSLIQGRPS